jgi:hypothetical protein
VRTSFPCPLPAMKEDVEPLVNESPPRSFCLQTTPDSSCSATWCTPIGSCSPALARRSSSTARGCPGSSQTSLPRTYVPYSFLSFILLETELTPSDYRLYSGAGSSTSWSTASSSPPLATRRWNHSARWERGGRFVLQPSLRESARSVKAADRACPTLAFYSNTRRTAFGLTLNTLSGVLVTPTGSSLLRFVHLLSRSSSLEANI